MPTLTVTRSFPHPPAAIYDAWLEERTAGRWLFATPTGEMRRVEIDRRVGGGFTIVRRDGHVDAVHRGEYLELARSSRLVFDFWVEPFSAGQKTRVALDIAPEGEGGSALTLTHEGVPDEWADKTREGWAMILDSLARELG